MNLGEFVRGLRKHVRLLVLFVVLGGAAGVGLTFVGDKEYRSETKIYVTVPQSGGSLAQAYQGTLFTQERVRSYADLATTQAVLGSVAQSTGESPTELAKRVQVTVPVDSVILSIAVNGASPDAARQTADKVAQSLVTAVGKLEADEAAATPRPGATQQQPVRVVKLSVVEPGTVPEGPEGPGPILFAAGGMVLGALLGVLFGALRNALDTRIREPRDLALVTAEPLLAEIPLDPKAQRQPIAPQADWYGARAEAFRSLRTNLRFVQVDDPPRVIVVTSSNAKEGKSSTAVNIAVALTLSGASTILVDADLRRPTVHRYFDVVPDVGLTSILLNEAEPADVVQTVSVKNPLHIIASGPIPPNPSELLGSEQMKRTLKQLAGLADYVIIDAPPLLPVTDAAVITNMADGAVMVVRARETRRDELAEAMRSLRAANGRVLGMVLNGSRSAKEAYRYRYDPKEQPRQNTTGRKSGPPPQQQQHQPQRRRPAPRA